MRTILGHSFDQELPRELDFDLSPDGCVLLCMHPPGKKGPEKIVVPADKLLSMVRSGSAGRVAGHSPRGDSKSLAIRLDPRGLCIIIGRWWGVFQADDVTRGLNG